MKHIQNTQIIKHGKPRLPLIAIVLLLVVGSYSQVMAASITLDATSDGRHGSGSSSTGNDYSSGTDAGFRTFDLSSVTGTITSAYMLLNSANPGNPLFGSGSTVVMYDVSTPHASLGVGGGSATIFADLTSGVSFGTFVHTYGTNNNTGTFNAAGISDLNSSLGGLWSVGLATPVGESFGYNGVSLPPQQLILTTAAAAAIPEPSTMLLFGTGLAGLIGWQYRKKQIK